MFINLQTKQNVQEYVQKSRKKAREKIQYSEGYSNSLLASTLPCLPWCYIIKLYPLFSGLTLNKELLKIQFVNNHVDFTVPYGVVLLTGNLHPKF